MGKHFIVEIGDKISIIGPRPGHTWNEHKDMWPVCEIDNGCLWDDPEVKALDHANAAKVCAALNASQ